MILGFVPTNSSRCIAITNSYERIAMSFNTKIKDDSSRAISTLLLYVLDSCRKGDTDIASEIGLNIDSMRLLEKLKPDQITHLSNSYLREKCPYEIFNLDLNQLSFMIERAAADSDLYEVCDEFLRLGASKNMMRDLFGMRSTQVANRKKFLNIKSVLGRMTVVSVQEQRIIYDAWLATIKETDFRLRLLKVARETSLQLFKVYNVVNEIEEVKNPKHNQRHCA